MQDTLFPTDDDREVVLDDDYDLDDTDEGHYEVPDTQDRLF